MTTDCYRSNAPSSSLLQIMAAILLLMTSCAGGCHKSPTSAAPVSKMSAEEQGATEALGDLLTEVTRTLVYIDRQFRMRSDAEQQGNLQLVNTINSRINNQLDIYKNALALGKKRAMESNRPVMTLPESMQELSLAIVNMYSVGHSIGEGVRMDTPQLQQVLDSLRAVQEADLEFASRVAARQASPDLLNPNVTLNLEIVPFPFKIELPSGKFRVKKTFAAGPLKGDIGGNFGGARTGITTLILVHNGRSRHFAVGGRVLELEVPACRIEVNDSVMTITTLD